MSSNFKFFLAFIITSMIITSCQSDDKKWQNPLQCTFVKENGWIKTNYENHYDIIPGVDLGGNGQIVNFDIYNYGNDLRINRNALNDFYSGSLAEISHYYVVSAEGVAVKNNLKDSLYGEWATGKVLVPSFDRICEDVFISPLAFRQIQNPSNNVSLILVRLLSIDDNCYFNGLFVGDYRTEIIINNHYSKVVTKRTGASFGSSNSWPRWSPLFTDDQFKAYRSHMSLKSAGIDAGLRDPLEMIKKDLER